MKVSIIIPCFNMAEYLVEAVDSVLAQTYQDWQLIIIDDRSTDSSWQIAKELPYQDKRILAFQHSWNCGLAATRNTGVGIATSEFVLPLDADDKIDPLYLEKTLPLMTEGVGVVSTDMMYFGTHSLRIPPTHVTLEQAMHYNGIPVCSLIRKQAFKTAGGYKTEMSEGCEDWELWLSILQQGWKIAVLNEPLFYYRRKPVSMVSSMNRGKMIEVMKSLHPDLPWSAQ